jgi:hypothetical protein
MSIENISTVTQRFPTEDPRITKIIIGNVSDNGVIIAKRVYYEVDAGERKLIAIDWFSALTTIYDFDMENEN